MEAKTISQTLNELAEEKDIKRIEDLFARSNHSDEKLIKLTQQMANSITDKDKAMRRAEAAWKVLGKENNPLADIFLARVKELGGNTDTSTSVANPRVDLQQLRKDNSDNVGVIFLPASALAIWEWEITGQLSSGAWENTNPEYHWRYWNNLEPRIGTPEIQSTGYPVKSGYNLAGLIEYIGDRMVKYGRFGKAVGTDILNMGSEVRISVEDFPTDGPFNLKEWKENMIKHSNWRSNDYYWKGLKQKHIDAYYKTSYSEKDMRKDLSLIKQVMKENKDLKRQ